MSAFTRALLADLTEAELRELAERLRPYFDRDGPSEAADPWLNTNQAAEHLACPRSRVHDLVQLGKLAPCRDGRRLLFRRADLDAYLETAA